LKAAEDAVNCITKGDIAVLKGLAKPPPDVKNVTMVVCMFFKKTPEMKMNPETQKKEKDYWGPSIKMMMDPGFLKSLINYEKEEIQQELIEQIAPIIT
jgi:dynein heavy chain